jgi:hypothetical protein
VKRNAERFMTGIFCDDIRHEMGNKLSFMGCYQSELLVPAMPAVLPKLCVYVSAWTPKNKPFKALTLRVVQDDDKELARIDIPPDGLEESAQIQDETATRKTVSTAIAFSPFVIEKLTTLRLMATTEEGDIVGPRLMIKLLPGQETHPPATSKKEKPANQSPRKPKPAAKKTGTKSKSRSGIQE